jgi:hypothetical protein
MRLSLVLAGEVFWIGTYRVSGRLEALRMTKNPATRAIMTTNIVIALDLLGVFVDFVAIKNPYMQKFMRIKFVIYQNSSLIFGEKLAYSPSKSINMYLIELSKADRRL